MGVQLNRNVLNQREHELIRARTSGHFPVAYGKMTAGENTSSLTESPRSPATSEASD